MDPWDAQNGDTSARAHDLSSWDSPDTKKAPVCSGGFFVMSAVMKLYRISAASR